MNGGFQFNARQVKPDEGFTTIPGGQYRLAIVKSNIKPVKDSQNKFFLSLVLKVMDGPHANTVMQDNLNLWNDSQQAVEIAYSRLSAYCHATQVLDLNIPGQPAPDCAAQQLHNIPFLADVGVQGDYNRIKKVMPLGTAGPGGPQMTQAPQGPAPGAGWGTQPPAAGPTNQWGAPPAQGPAPQGQPGWPAQAPQGQPPQQFQQPQQPPGPQGQQWPAQAPQQPPQGGTQWVQAGPPPADPSQQPPNNQWGQPQPAAAAPAPQQGWQPTAAPQQPPANAPWGPQGGAR